MFAEMTDRKIARFIALAGLVTGIALAAGQRTARATELKAWECDESNSHCAPGKNLICGVVCQAGVCECEAS